MVWTQMASRWLIFFFLLAGAVLGSTSLEMDVEQRHRSPDVTGSPGGVHTRTLRSPSAFLAPTGSTGLGGSATRSPGLSGAPTASPGVGARRQERSSSSSSQTLDFMLVYNMSDPSGEVRAECLSTTERDWVETHLYPSDYYYPSHSEEYIVWAPGDEPRSIECRSWINRHHTVVAPFIDHSAPFVPDRLSFTVAENEDFDLSLTTRSREKVVMWQKEPTRPARWRKAVLTNDSRLIIPSDQLSGTGLYSVAPYDSSPSHRVERSDIGTFSLLVTRCSPHRFGANCDQWCPDCMNGGVCDDLSGDCICTPWFSGHRCQTRLPAIDELHEYYDKLKGEEGIQLCLPGPFGCRCFPGYTGLKCDKGCEIGRRTVDCSQNCEHCLLTCEEVDGSCYAGVPGPCSKDELGLPRLRKPPKITNIQEDGAEVYLQEWNPDYDDGQVPGKRRISSYILVLLVDDREVRRVTVTPPSWRLTGLRPATRYGVRVLVEVDYRRGKTCVANGTGGRERIYTTRFTTNCPIRPPSPTGVTVTNVTSSGFMVKWQAVPNAELCNFTYCISLRDVYHYPDSTEYNVSGLQPYTSYSIALLTYHSPTNTFSTKAYTLSRTRTLPSAPGPVTHLRVDKKHTSLVVRWDDPDDRPPKGRLETFFLCWRKGGEPWTMVTLPGLKHSYTLDNLQRGEEYIIRVRAKNADVEDYGPFVSLTTQMTSGKPSVPRYLHVLCTAQKDIAIQWVKPETTNGPISNYTASARIVQSLGSGQQISHNTTATSTQITGLKAGQRYKVRVAACTSQACGDEAELLVWTKPTTPHPRSGVELVDAASSTITIRLPTIASFPVWQWVLVAEAQAILTKDLATDLVLNEDLRNLSPSAQVWVAAILPLEDDGGGISEFVVGNGRVYGGFYNRPLAEGARYHLMVVTEAKAGPHREVYASAQRTFQSKAPSHTGAVVASILAVMLLLGLLLAGAFWWRRFGYKRFRQLFGPREVNSNFLLGFFRRRRASADNGHARETDVDQVQVLTPKNHYRLQGLTAADDESEGTRRRTPTRRVYRAEAETYLARAIHSPETEAEFMSVPASMSKSCSDAERGENRLKNHYGYNLPYNETRVRLACLPGSSSSSSDYINASYIQGHSRPGAFIATQGPMDSPVYTVGDFWRMVWETNTNIIVMLTTLKKTGAMRVVQYWPEKEKQPMVKDGIQVTLVSSEVKMDFIMRRLLMSTNSEIRSVVQYHYKAWPVHGLPQSPFGLAHMLNHLMEGHRTGPIIVHCSAGTGPTGTVILALYVLDQLNTSGYMDVREALTTLRNGRAKLVENKFEYVFGHQLLHEILTGMRTRYRCGDFPKEVGRLRLPQPHSGVSLIHKQFKEVKALPKDLTYNIAKDPVCAKLNRNPDILPADGKIAFLQSVSVDLQTQYINVVRVSAMDCKNAYLAGEHPQHDTVSDLWKLVYQRKVPVWVLLQTFPDHHPEFPEVVPGKEPTAKGGTLLTLTDQISFKEFDEYHVDMTAPKSRECVKSVTRKCVVLKMKGWPHTQPLPASPEALLAVIDRAKSVVATQQKGMLFTCKDGVEGCGVAMAMLQVADRIDLLQEVDVYRSVLSVTYDRPQFVTSVEQYDFLHDAALHYLRTNQHYGNFN